MDSFPKVGYCAVCYGPQYDTPSGVTCEVAGHGGVETLDEIPTCDSCSEPLTPDAKFCNECGESTEPKKEEEVEENLCPSCKEPVDEGAKFCGECGYKLVKGKKVEKKEKTEKADEPVEDKKLESESEPEESEEDEPEEAKVQEEESEAKSEEDEFDFSEVNPAEDWECYGQIEPDHSECKACAYRVSCAKESKVELKEA